MSKERKYYWFNDGSRNIKISSPELAPDGFVPGRKCIPWNKGLTKETSEILLHVGDAVSKARTGKPAPNKGKPASEHQKIKQSEKMKARYANGEISAWNKGLTKETDSRVKKISDKMQGHKAYTSEEAVLKMLNSKRRNKTFNTSKIEDTVFEYLCKKYPDYEIKRQFSDKSRYPFQCDFYVKDLDLFIELNAHWTHGGQPFDESDPLMQKQLNEWKEKAKTSSYYNYAINVWTISDVKKLSYAKKYNLNYLTIYNPKDILI